MKIEPLSGNNYYPGNIRKSNSDSTEQSGAKIKDKLELSSEAKSISKNQAENTGMDKIKEKINSKFYDSPDVISKIADKILKNINAG